jgi:hypothetical protein
VIGLEVFFGQEFDGVRDGLQQAPGANAHRPQTRLHERRNFAFEIRSIGRPDGHARHDRADLYERPDDVIDRLLPQSEPQQESVD